MLIHGKSTCNLCGKIFQDGEKLIHIPNVFGNRLDPFSNYCGRTFHKTCFQNCEVAQKTLARIKEIEEEQIKKYLLRAKDKKAFINAGYCQMLCYISGESNFGDTFQELEKNILGLPYMTGDKTSPLYEYNCVMFHKNNFRKWDKRQWLIDQIKVFDASGQWGGPMLKHIIQRLEEAINETEYD